MLASLLWAVGPVHFDEAKVPKQVHMWYDKPNGFFTTTDYFNTCALFAQFSAGTSRR